MTAEQACSAGVPLSPVRAKEAGVLPRARLHHAPCVSHAALHSEIGS